MPTSSCLLRHITIHWPQNPTGDCPGKGHSEHMPRHPHWTTAEDIPFPEALPCCPWPLGTTFATEIVASADTGSTLGAVSLKTAIALLHRILFTGMNRYEHAVTCQSGHHHFNKRLFATPNYPITSTVGRDPISRCIWLISSQPSDHILHLRWQWH